MSGLRAINPPGWKQPRGYSNALIGRGTLAFIAGQVGWNAEEKFESDDFIAQVRQALRNTADILAAGGAKPEHIARMTWYVTDKRQYLSRLPEVGATWREIMGRHFPAMSLVEVSALLEDRALIEIETTAVIPD